MTEVLWPGRVGEKRAGKIETLLSRRGAPDRFIFLQAKVTLSLRSKRSSVEAPEWSVNLPDGKVQFARGKLTLREIGCASVENWMMNN